MSEEKYVIVDIHPSDVFYELKDKLLGLCLVPDKTWHESFVDKGELYMAGGATLENRLELLGNGNYICFFAVMAAPLSEVENK